LQLDERSEQQRITQLTLDEKRTQCSQAERRAREVEEHYLNSTQRIHEKVTNDLKV